MPGGYPDVFKRGRDIITVGRGLLVVAAQRALLVEAKKWVAAGVRTHHLLSLYIDDHTA